MAMTKEERATRDYLAEKLGEQGYATYAKLFMLFDLRLTSDPRFIGYMEPGKARITLNRTLDEHQMKLTIRHEILHEYLSHEMRLLDHIAELNPQLDPDDVSLKEILYSDDVFNIAADYEISNRGYTEQDKNDIRNIKFNGQIVSGLVTEDKHPDWVDLSVEEMYDLLKDERKKAQEEAEQEMNDDESQDTESQSEQGEGDEGNQSGEQSDDNSDSNDGESDGSSGESDDGESEGESDDEGQGASAEGEQGESGEESEGEGSSGQEGEQEQNKQNSNQGNSQGNQSGQNNQQGSSDGKSNGDSSMKVIRGTMKDGKFYGLDGKEIVPGA